MKQVFILAAFLLCALSLLAQSPASTLSGIVTDSAIGKPLGGVSVYLSNTSRGTATRNNGGFTLAIPPGAYQLVFSAIGYQTVVLDIDGNHLPAALKIALHGKAEELAAVTVEPYDKNGWRRWSKYFLDNFIGTGDNASKCSLINHEVLRFRFSRKTQRLIVTATEPLIIENDGLGYNLTFQLESFTSDLTKKTVTYFGYPYFQEMTTKKENHRLGWVFNRKQAYHGSIMHFMRSLYAGRTISEGFLTEKQVTVDNEEKQRIKNVYRPDFQRAGEFPMDTLHYFWDVLRQPDKITKMVVVPPDSILFVYSNGTKGLFFNGELAVLYGVNARASGDYQASGLVLSGSRAIGLEENGHYYPAQALLSTGIWAHTEKIANLLPLDYEPH